MQAFFTNLSSEFYKSRKTLAFWAAILLPVLICSLVFCGYYFKADEILKMNMPPQGLWLKFISASLAVMGILILPFYIIFMAFSVNNIEHKNSTWPMLFTLPFSKVTIYSAKYAYSVLLIFICLVLFSLLTVGTGHLLAILNPRYAFDEWSPVEPLLKMYSKLFLASLGILSLQLLFSLIWSDFLKPMGIGFVGVIGGLIAANAGWKYAYLIPYCHPAKALNTADETIPVFTQEIWVSLVYAVVFFILGFYIVSKRSVK